ncbi:protein translocase subunit SecF [Acutalibacter sp. JLR.KK004]|uniref:protein translocase subunit SecF n=1 Tax=Acutalibacter sp. JLR.KK004 TaxID=3112622 RepID=UPI002FEED39C
MKRVKKPVFFVVLVLICALVFTSLFGLYGQNGDFKTTILKGVGDIRWGIDIRGGVEATFSPAGDVQATDSELESAKQIIETRMVAQNITDYELYTDSGNNRIIVRFPWKSDETDFDPETAINELSATAMLTFREGGDYETMEYGTDGQPVYKTPSGTTADTIILEGSDVVKAEPGVQQSESTGATEYVVSLELSDSGKEKFSEATGRLVGSVISIWMDDVRLSAPTVNEAITDGKCIISGGFTSEYATTLAAQIQAGALPFALETSNFNALAPTLGANALNAMMLAGIIAFALIAVLMIVVFRLPGVVAVISLAGQMGICFAAITGFFPNMNSFTMTLPGIAGLILSIGIGVDANVITASRVREELRAGKTLDGALQRGFQSSFWAIFDGNITTAIVAVMLMGVFGPSNILSLIFGESTTGSIFSFGFTLLVGIIANFIMGVFATRMMTLSLAGFKCLHRKWLFGGSKEDGQAGSKTEKVWDFFSNRKTFYIISAAVLVVGIVASAVIGPKLDIQFAGGAMIRYTVDGTGVTSDAVAQTIQDKLGKTASVSLNTDMGTGGQQATISFSGNQGMTPDEQKEVADTLSDAFHDATFTLLESNSVDATMGAKFFQKCLVCFALTAVLLLAYIALRFKKIGGLSAGLTAIVALLHDVLISFCVFVVFGMPINDIFIAVVLTILGYSLNSTIVIYDRVRENKRKFGSKTALNTIMNQSLSQTLGRTLLTSLTTFLALVAVLAVAGIYSISSVISFSLPMMVGVVAGCFSSQFIAPTLFAAWQNHVQAKEKSNS